MLNPFAVAQPAFSWRFPWPKARRERAPTPAKQTLDVTCAQPLLKGLVPPRYSLCKAFVKGSDGLKKIAHLTAEQRQCFELNISNQKWVTAAYELFDTGADVAKWVMDENGKIYGGVKRQFTTGSLHHASFLDAAPVAAAGLMKVVAGELRYLVVDSGGYLPNIAMTLQMLRELQTRGLSLAHVPLGVAVDGVWRWYDAADVHLMGGDLGRCRQCAAPLTSAERQTL